VPDRQEEGKLALVEALVVDVELGIALQH
jgi:hypothetical protein